MGRPPTLRAHDVAEDGDAVGVLLFNRPDRVWLHRQDYERIATEHGMRPWNWHERARYVRLQTIGGADLSVARLVASKVGKITYRDGNRINLRRENLVLGRPGYGRTVGRGKPANVVSPSHEHPFPPRPSAPPVSLPRVPKAHPVVVASIKRGPI